ncbi:MAG TPA: T9SS type A sorting domain-containing protein, partial [Chitinophagales bacterium]|nr:T9SS type A sorting domain-containing protein [Chitinophagales bacterium]
TLTINPLNDTVPGNNVVALHQLITNAWDPNEKSVAPEGMIAAGTELNYTIHFQNTGNAVAANIVVRDTLDTGLDPMTFRLTGSSHPFNFAMSGNGIATFTFYNIQLPDSGTNFAGSNGWVSYAVKTLDALAPLTIVKNTAGIYFDYNPAVMTNAVTDTIQEIATGTNTIEIKTFYIKAAPNPSSGNVVFVFSNDLNEKANLEITSIDGKIMLSESAVSSDESIDIGSLPSGIYICSLKSAAGEHFVKLVKE